MLSAVETTAGMTRKRILDIRELLNEAVAIGRRKLPARVYSKDLIELIFRE